MEERIVQVKIVGLPKFELSRYNALCKSALFSLKTVPVVTTLDLAAMFSRMNSDIDQEFSYEGHSPSRSLCCLGLLAQEGLIDLSFSLVYNNVHTIINLTPSADPYWVIPNRYAGIDTFEEAKLPTVTLTSFNVLRDFYARPVDNAVEKLLEKANNDWFLRWKLSFQETKETWDWTKLPEIPADFAVIDNAKEVRYNI